MKADKFITELEKRNLNEGIKTPVFWTEDDEGNIFIDFESMKEEFKDNIKELDNILK